MELTERERRILAELEHQFPTGTPGTKERPREGAPIRRRLRRRWTVAAAAVLGILLLVTGIGLGVTSSVLLGTLLVVWWLFPLLWRLLRRVGRAILESFEDAPPGDRL
jgi:accessory gene regulator protein AgrB